MAAGSGSTPASRKPESPRKFSSSTETKKIPGPFVSSELPQAGPYENEGLASLSLNCFGSDV
jgi:hypothetical protein